MELLSKMWIKTYLDIAALIAEHSHDPDKKVGAILVKDRRIISTGFNGMPTGFDNSCKDDTGRTRREVLHAETNAISKCCKSVESSEGSIMFLTLSPCFECSKLIIQCGIQAVYYAETWKDTSGLELLGRAGIPTYAGF